MALKEMKTRGGLVQQTLYFNFTRYFLTDLKCDINSNTLEFTTIDK